MIGAEILRKWADDDKVKRICKNCIYHDNGFCKKYPPKQFIIISQTCEGEYFFETSYPFVEKSDWCGEWKPSLVD